MRRLLLIASLLLALFGPGFGQLCFDPAPPLGGFPIVEVPSSLETWTDGYQAYMDLRYPVAGGPCGSPLIVFVHGGGGSRNVVADEARAFARLGFVTCAYDVRGQGPSMALNPLGLAHDLVGLRELIDLFEAIETAEARLPLRIDFTRIGVTGYSQGAVHSWWAAQHSGRLPPPNPWRIAPFPTVRAVALRDGEAQIQGPPTSFPHRLYERLFTTTNITIRPSVIAAFQPIVLAENLAAYSAMTNVPGMNANILLPLSNVPVLAHASYDDNVWDPSQIYEAFRLLPNATPKRFFFGTGGHESPANAHDFALFEQTRIRWFQRFLRNELNGVESEPEHRATVTPDLLIPYLQSSTLLDFRQFANYPSAAVTVQDLYLSPADQLTVVPPAGVTASNLLHLPPAGFGPAAYAAAQPTAAQLQAIIPLDSETWDTPALLNDRHLLGPVTGQFRINAAAPDFQIHAVIEDVGPNGAARFVSDGVLTMRGSPGVQTITLQTYFASYVFRAGHRIRLRLNNLDLHDPTDANPATIHEVPVFTPFAVDVIEGGAILSFLQIPFATVPGPRLVSYPLQQSLSSPADQLCSVHTESGMAGAPCILLPSISGTTPGTPLGALTVPLNFDALTDFVILYPNTPPFAGTFAAHDGFGRFHPSIQLSTLGPLPLPLPLELSLCAVTIDGASLVATQAITIPFGL